MDRHYSAIRMFLISAVMLVSQFNVVFAQPTISWVRLSDETAKGVVLSPNGSLIAYSSLDDGITQVLDLNTNETLWQSVGSWSQSEWSPDGQWIATLQGNVALYEASTGVRTTEIEKTFEDVGMALGFLNQIPELEYTDLHWSANSQKLAAMVHGYIVVYDFSVKQITQVVDLVMIQNNDLHNYLSWFDWSEINSNFAAFRYDVNDRTRTPPRIVMGFWDEQGLQANYSETSNVNQSDECLPRGDELFQGFARSIGNDLAWAPDGETIAISAGPVTVCSLGSDGTVSGVVIYDYAAEQLQWSVDQRLLFGVYSNCSVLIAEASDNYAVQFQSVSSSDVNCITQSSNWSHDGNYVLIGTTDGLWLGEVEYP